MEVEDYRQLLNTFLTAPMQTVGMIHLFNLSDVHESISRIWRELFSCTGIYNIIRPFFFKYYDII